MVTNFAKNPCLADGGSGMDTTWMDTQCVREGGGDGGDGGDTIYNWSRVVVNNCTNSCVKPNGTSWILSDKIGWVLGPDDGCP